jgi:hypothetical protein
MTNLIKMEEFWQTMEPTSKLSQLQRYEQHNAPDVIKKFIAIGGGPRMGTTLEQYARFHFPLLQKRDKGKQETGYDQLILPPINTRKIYVEQKSSGHWGESDYKWQHVEEKHKWDMLLLCGIDYTDIKFWGMNRQTFAQLIADQKITNQGSKGAESSEGMWFNYTDVQHALTPIETEAHLRDFAAALKLE